MTCQNVNFRENCNSFWRENSNGVEISLKKSTFIERRRSYYHLKKEALTQKVGKNEFARISATKNLAELPDPFEAYGKVEIDNLKNEANEKRNSMKSNPGDKIDVIEFEDEANDEVTEKLSPLGSCQYYQKARCGNLRKILTV